MAGSAAHGAAQPGGRREPSSRLRRLLRDDETLLWSAKPHAQGWYVGTVAGITLTVLLVGTLLGVPATWVAFVEGSSTYPLGAGTTALLGLAVLLLAAGGAALLAHLTYRHAEMGLTEDRLVRLGGLVGQDASSVALEDVRDVEVRVYPFDRLFGTGRIRVTVPGSPVAGLRMGYVADPYETLEQIERLRAEAAGEVGDGS